MCAIDHANQKADRWACDRTREFARVLARPGDRFLLRSPQPQRQINQVRASQREIRYKCAVGCEMLHYGRRGVIIRYDLRI